MQLLFFCASLPHRRNATGVGRLAAAAMMQSVKRSQPCPKWDCGVCLRTLRTVLRRSTPCFAHARREPDFGILIPRSVSRSLKMFLKEGGRGCFSGTLKARPWACPGP